MLVWLVCLLAHHAKDFSNFCGEKEREREVVWGGGKDLEYFSKENEHCAAFLGRRFFNQF
jgi:hypothetical protein